MKGMQVTLVMVMSLDGRTTKGGNEPTGAWASAEDQTLFRTILSRADLIVMGSATYRAVRSVIQPSDRNPRIVLTSRPKQFTKDERPGLSFMNETPEGIVHLAARQGKRNVFLVGGAKTATRFFNGNCVDEVVVTIEPWIFGRGLGFVNTLRESCHLELVECTQLNRQGTLFVRYKVANDREQRNVS